MTEEPDRLCVFRNPGTTDLFIFKRDETLLRTRSFSSIYLSDINPGIIDFLGQLRARNIRFGFISDQKGMDGGTQGKTDAAALINVLDSVLNANGVMPDFWIASPYPHTEPTKIQRQNEPPLQIGAMVEQARQWYGVEKAHCVFVGSSQASLAHLAALGFRTMQFKDLVDSKPDLLAGGDLAASISGTQPVVFVSEKNTKRKRQRRP